MRDDRLQGILFNRSEQLDLVQRKRHERLLHKMLTQKNAINKWQARLHSIARLQSSGSTRYAINRKSNYDLEITRLATRLKTR